MKKIISAKSAGNILLIIFSALIVFHILVLTGLVPADIVWGGRVNTLQITWRVFEFISLVFTILFAIIVAIKFGYIKPTRFGSAVTVFLWLMFAFLLLNTLGNLTAESLQEKLIFTPITIIASLLVLRLAVEIGHGAQAAACPDGFERFVF
ncbi:MAG: hypothetical protein ONB12_01470 [candidate division KSB1 bacterium]|nr:hypothetical protein [candidate division KSB1 bacterium]